MAAGSLGLIGTGQSVSSRERRRHPRGCYLLTRELCSVHSGFPLPDLVHCPATGSKLYSQATHSAFRGSPKGDAPRCDGIAIIIIYYLFCRHGPRVLQRRWDPGCHRAHLVRTALCSGDVTPSDGCGHHAAGGRHRRSARALLVCSIVVAVELRGATGDRCHHCGHRSTPGHHHRGAGHPRPDHRSTDPRACHARPDHQCPRVPNQHTADPARDGARLCPDDGRALRPGASSSRDA